MEIVGAWLIAHMGLTASIGGFIASEILPFIPIKSNSVILLLTSAMRALADMLDMQAKKASK